MKQPYSVLLLYPDYLNDSGSDTTYYLVEAEDAGEAINLARLQSSVAHDGAFISPEDFAPLLVTQGHHRSEPLFDQFRVHAEGTEEHSEGQGVETGKLGQRETITVEVRGGMVESVYNLPLGWGYEVVDHDAQSEAEFTA